MNAIMLAQMLGMDSAKAQRLEEAWKTAQQAAQGISTLSEAQKAVRQFGINSDVIEKASTLLNNPLAGVVASRLGVNIQGAQKALQVLAGKPEQHFTGLDTLRQGLNQLKSC